MDSIGRRIKAKRNEAGYGQEELAHLLGKTSKQVISNWENDKNEPTLSDMIKLAKTLNTTVGFLIGEESNATDPDLVTVRKDELIELQQLAIKNLKKDLEKKSDQAVHDAK